MCWGWDSERIAGDLQLPLNRVKTATAAVEQKLRAAGRSVALRKIQTVSLSAMFPGDEEEQPGIPEPPADNLSPELRSEALGFWSKLSAEDRTLLRLVVQSGRSIAEIASAVHRTQAQVYTSIYRIRKEMPEWFKTPAGETKTPSGSVQTETGSNEG